MSVEVGTAYVTVVPSAKGFASKLQGELGGTMAAAGSKAGDSAGKGFGSRFSAGVKVAAVAGAAALAAAAGAAIGFGKDAIAEARESQKVGATTNAIIKATGGAAKVSAAQIGDLAGAISAKTGVDDEVIQSGANMLLTFKNVRNEAGKGADVFNRATQAAADLSAAGFGDMAGQSKMLGKALNDPVKGISALSRSGVTFTAQQKEQIKTLVASGKTLEAQKIILGEVESQVGGTAAASATMGEKLSVSFGNFKEQVGTAMLPYLDKAQAILLEKVIPAVSKFFSEMQDGTGKGGEFVAFVKDAADKLQAIAGFIQRNSDVIVPFVAAIASAVAVFKIITTAVKVYTAVQAALNVVLLMNPIGLVIVAIAALVAGIIVAYKKSETFRNIVKGAFEAIGKAATFMWNNVVAPVIRFLIKAFASVADFYAALLRGMSKIPGFGWAAGAADKLQGVANKARNIADNIKDIPSQKTVNIDIYARSRTTGRIDVGGQKVNVGMRAHGGPVKAGQPYVVGERRPELFVPNTDGRIIPSVPKGGKTDLSETSLQRLAAILAGTPMKATISAGSFDSAMAVGL